MERFISRTNIFRLSNKHKTPPKEDIDYFIEFSISLSENIKIKQYMEKYIRHFISKIEKSLDLPPIIMSSIYLSDILQMITLSDIGMLLIDNFKKIIEHIDTLDYDNLNDFEKNLYFVIISDKLLKIYKKKNEQIILYINCNDIHSLINLYKNIDIKKKKCTIL